MIVDTDRLELPSGVSSAGGQLEDVVRGCKWPLNASGTFVLGRVGCPLETVVRELAETFDLPLDVARFDVLRFVWMLNALALVNLVHSGSRLRRSADWFALAVRLLPAGALPTPMARRCPLDTVSVRRAVASTLRAASGRVAAVTASSTVALLAFVAAVGGRGFVLALALGAGTGIGVGLHEAGHAASLRGIPSALVCRGLRTFVLHAPVGAGRRSLVAVSGPGVVVAAGLVLVVTGAMTVAPWLVILGLPLAAHALSLTVIAGDGKSACGI